MKIFILKDLKLFFRFIFFYGNLTYQYIFNKFTVKIENQAENTSIEEFNMKRVFWKSSIIFILLWMNISISIEKLEAECAGIFNRVTCACECPLR